MDDQKDLPKPLTDLPLPEKEISEQATPASQGQALRSYNKTNILKSKFFLGFVALSILIAFLLGGLLLGKNSSNKQAPTPIGSPKPTAKAASPTPDPTTNWKTYTLEALTFKAPLDWWSDHLDNSTIRINPTKFEGTETSPALMIGIEKNTSINKIGIELTTKSSTDKDFIKEFTTKDTTIAGKPGLIVKTVIPPGFDVKDHTSLTAYAQYGSDVYTLTSSDYTIPSKDQQNLFDQILSTFTFAPLSTSKFTQ